MLVKGASALGVLMVLWYLKTVIFFFTSCFTNLAVLLTISWVAGKVIAKRWVLPQLPSISPEQKAVLITGCDTGFGHHAALALNKLGFIVYAGCYNIKSSESESLQKSCKSPDKMRLLQMDVTNEDQIKEALRSLKDSLGPNNQLFALINNAGLLDVRMVEWSNDGSAKDLQKILDVNVVGSLRVTRTFLPLIRQSRGRIINVNSQASRFTMSGLGCYTASKGAAIKLTEALVNEVSHHGVTVISVEPFFVKTPMTEMDIITNKIKAAFEESSQEVQQAYGQEEKKFLDHLTNFVMTDPRAASTKLEDVVHALVHGVTSYEPDAVYAVGPCEVITVLKLFELLPYEVQNFVRPLAERLTIRFLTEK